MAPKKSSIDNTLVISDIISPVDDDDKFGLQNALSKPARRLRRKTQTKTIQKFIKKRYHADYKKRIMLELEKLKNRAIKKVRIDLTKINVKALASRIGVLSDGLKLTMILPSSNRYYALNDRTINLLMKGKIDTNATIGGPEAPTFSDSDIQDLLEEETEVIVTIISIDKTRPGGAFFAFLNKTIYDLSKYGVFKSVDKNNYNHNCLYLALQAGGLSDVKLQELILTLRNRTIHKCDLTNVCNTLEINIELISLRSDGKTNIVEHYPTSPYIQYDEKYNLGLVKGHYFINDYTELTSYCLENYDEVKDLKESNMIWKKKGKYYERDKTGKRFIKAFQLFKILMDNIDSLITPMELTDDILSTQFYDKVNDYKTLEYNKKNCRLEEYVEKDKDHYKIFFDFETITSEYKHMPYLCWIYNDDIQQEFIGINNCAVDMLNALPTDKKEILLIAHNSDYDCRFILEYLQNKVPIVKSGRFLQIKATYYNPISKKKIKLVIKDSYKLIPMPLRDFGKCFNLDCHKEVMPYGVYTYKNVNMGACSINDALSILKDDEKQQFLDNIKKWDCILVNDKFDLIKYSSIYCKMDCEVLMKGYEVFRGWMLEHTQLDVDDFITIQSMASSFMLKSGCYDNVYQISGVLQQFISRCVVGGRVMTNSNKQYHVKRKIADFDACSLYPSAMHYMDGFLEGTPKVLYIKTYEFLQQQDGYFIRIKIIKLNKHLDFPLTSKLNENGVRDFINEMENEIIYIDKVGLEELIEYHDIEFEIIDGYYYNEGRNNKINHVIKDLYDLRKKLKKDKNPAQIVIKLLMNSMYGKTIIKPVETDTVVKDTKEDFEKYISYNYNYIDSVIEVNGTYYIKKVKSILSHYNYVHCGVEILSMSKRIMNRVFGSAADIGVKIYYQDTDSIHLNYEDVDKVVKRYKEKYGLDLVGEELGQFHIDFPDIEKGCGEVYAIQSFFLGKKTYYDELESTSKDGRTINADLSRMKGIPTSCIEYYAKVNNISVKEIYSQLFYGKSIEFDLTNNNNKCVFRNNKDHTISSLYEGQKGTTRTCKFLRNDDDKIVIN